MSKKIIVKGIEVSIINQNGEDYISLTDMIKAKTGHTLIENWLRNRNTIEFLGIWESINNPGFNSLEVEGIKKAAGLNSFSISTKEWTEKTNSVGLIAKPGRYGGTYAHKDIAFEFGTWISAEFKLYLIKEFQRLKEQDNKSNGQEWDYSRFLSKVNYRLQTDAIKKTIIPVYKKITKEQETYIYANEAELLNMAVFGFTSKQWKDKNEKAHMEGKNIRDLANILQLTVLSNLENYNSILIKQGTGPQERFIKLKEEAIFQLKSLSQNKYAYSIESPHI